MQKVKVGVMGASDGELPAGEKARLETQAEQLGAAIADRGCVLVTGATTGLPDMVSRAARKHGALTVGISPAGASEEHERFGLPLDGVTSFSTRASASRAATSSTSALPTS